MGKGQPVDLKRPQVAGKISIVLINIVLIDGQKKWNTEWWNKEATDATIVYNYFILKIMEYRYPNIKAFVCFYNIPAAYLLNVVYLYQ